MNSDSCIRVFTSLYAPDKGGKTRVWNATVILSDSGLPLSVISYGQEGGKMQTVSREYTSGKNEGKKNETTPLDQCIQETERKWIDKKEKDGYVERVTSSHKSSKNSFKKGPFYPILAHTYEPDKPKQKIIYPCLVQPKLDGLRCITYLSEKSIIFQSRTAGSFDSMSHLVPSLQPIFDAHPDLVLDGELYTTDIPFEELAGLIKKKKIKEEDKERLRHVSYHVYDIVDPTEKISYKDRYATLQKVVKETPHIHIVDTYLVNNKTESKEMFAQFVENGYEGIMLRNLSGIYRSNYRSYDLQKYKEFFEEEYEIVDYKDGDGRDKGAVIWVCKTNSGDPFSVRPKGTMEMRQKWFKEGRKNVGKMLTVIYQELSEKGIPRFPVGKSIREGF